MRRDRNEDDQVFGKFISSTTAKSTVSRKRVLDNTNEKNYVMAGRHEKLRYIIQESVASMVSRKLLTRTDSDPLEKPIDRNAVEGFIDMLLRPGMRMPVLRAFLESNLPANHSELDKVLFIEAVGRHLGHLWEEDSCGMVDVAIGTARLQDLIHVLSGEFGMKVAGGLPPHAVVLVPEGEMHTLMVHLMGLLFDSLGWSRSVFESGKASPVQFKAELAHADIACIGWNNIRLEPEMIRLVSEIRHHAGDRRVPILVGGVAALDSVDLLVEMGIDCICENVYSAARICERYRDLTKISQHARTASRGATVGRHPREWQAS